MIKELRMKRAAILQLTETARIDQDAINCLSAASRLSENTHPQAG